MKKIILFLTLLISTTAFSQVVSLKENDRFTKKNVLQVNAMRGKKWKTADDIAEGLYKVVYFSLKAENTTYLLQLNIGVFGLTCLSENNHIILLLEDDSTIELFNLQKTECANQYQSLKGSYHITHVQINELSNKSIKEFRIYFSEGYTDYKVLEKNKDLIKATAKLFLEELTN